MTTPSPFIVTAGQTTPFGPGIKLYQPGGLILGLQGTEASVEPIVETIIHHGNLGLSPAQVRALRTAILFTLRHVARHDDPNVDVEEIEVVRLTHRLVRVSVSGAAASAYRKGSSRYLAAYGLHVFIGKLGGLSYVNGSGKVVHGRHVLGEAIDYFGKVRR